MRKEYQNWNEYQNAMVKQPKNLSTMTVKKPDNNVSRQMKRHATINVQGKSIRVMDHIEAMAKRLPGIRNKKTGEDFDHYEHLKRIYMEGGIDAVNEYLNVCKNVVNRDKGKWWFIRLYAKWRLKWRF